MPDVELDQIIDRARHRRIADPHRYWTCPRMGHSEGAWRTGPGETVAWDDAAGIAWCRYPDCQEISTNVEES